MPLNLFDKLGRELMGNILDNGYLTGPHAVNLGKS